MSPALDPLSWTVPGPGGTRVPAATVSDLVNAVFEGIDTSDDLVDGPEEWLAALVGMLTPEDVAAMPDDLRDDFLNLGYDLP